jgi:ACR3 family arsenite transporter
MTNKINDISFFERYLTIWVALCIVLGVSLGALAPEFAKTLDAMNINVNGAFL